MEKGCTINKKSSDSKVFRSRLPRIPTTGISSMLVTANKAWLLTLIMRKLIVRITAIKTCTGKKNVLLMSYSKNLNSKVKRFENSRDF
jgi:hypothetical protein